MDYKKIYFQLINKRKLNTVSGYIEQHHILPRCLGGTNDKNNIVSLTAREHYIAHALLVHMYIGTQYYYKLVHAFIMMSHCKNDNHERSYKINSKMYESLRNAYSENMSICQSGINNSQYGTMWVTNYSLRLSKKVDCDFILTDEWVKGRVVDWDMHDKKIKNNRVQKNRKMLIYAYKENAKYDFYYTLWIKYKLGNYKSIRSFCKQCDDVTVSHVSLTKMWKVYKLKTIGITIISFNEYLSETAMTPRTAVALKSGVFKGQTNARTTNPLKDNNGNVVILSVGDMVGKRTVNINLNGTDFYFPWAGNSYKIEQALKNKKDLDVDTSKGTISFSFESEYNGDMPILSVDSSDYFHFNKFNIALLKMYVSDKVKSITQD